MSFGENLKKLRNQKGYSQAQLGDILGITPQNIARYENNQTYPRVELLIHLSQLFNVSIDELLDNRLSPTKAIINELNQLLKGVYTIKEEVAAEQYAIESNKQKVIAVIPFERLLEIEHNMQTDTTDIITALLKQSAIRECEKVFKEIEYEQAFVAAYKDKDFRESHPFEFHEVDTKDKPPTKQ